MTLPNDPSSNVTALPMSSRGRPANTAAARLDRLDASLAELKSDLDLARSGLALLADSAAQAQRMRSFEESLRNSREYKIEEILRSTREVKDRLDKAEGDRAKYAALPITTWEALNTKITELSEMAHRAERAEWRAKFAAFLFGGSLLAVACWSILVAPMRVLG